MKIVLRQGMKATYDVVPLGVMALLIVFNWLFASWIPKGLIGLLFFSMPVVVVCFWYLTTRKIVRDKEGIESKTKN